ncbi:hypothetical protein GCM10023238_37220 [Streptomyces heliomycini]
MRVPRASLAATAELLPTHPSIAADPRLRGAAGRTVRNIVTIADRVADEDVTHGAGRDRPSIASLLGGDGTTRYAAASPTGCCANLERLDEAVVGLARPHGRPG